MKGANSCREIILMAFLKKFLFRVNGPFRTQNDTSAQLWICCKECSTILHNEKGQESHGNYVNGFFQKNPIQGNLVCHFGPKMLRLDNWVSSRGFCIFNFAQ